MSEEIKKTGQPEPAKAAELSEQELDQVAGGKNYLESRSNISGAGTPVAPTPINTNPVIKPAG